MIIVAILLILLSYLYGCFSTARVLAKSVKSLNIYKVGTGFADTENIYMNISKPLGVMAGALDVTKSYAYLYFLSMLLTAMDKMGIPPNLNVLYSTDLMMLYGIAMLIGHCLPLTNHLRGGRGIFTYMGLIAYFTFFPTIITGVVVLLIVFIFRQVRFAQYTIVLFPILLTQIFTSFQIFAPISISHNMVALYTTKLLGIAVIMGALNFIVSKKLGEF